MVWDHLLFADSLGPLLDRLGRDPQRYLLLDPGHVIRPGEADLAGKIAILLFVQVVDFVVRRAVLRHHSNSSTGSAANSSAPTNPGSIASRASLPGAMTTLPSGLLASDATMSLIDFLV